MPLRWPWRHLGFGRFDAQRQGRQLIGADVEHQHLKDAQGERERAAGERPDGERRQLGDVVGQVVGQEPADVAVGRAPLGDGRDDGGEVVVQQHQVGGFARHVGAAASHRHADVGRLEGRAVVHAVAGHRDDVPSRSKRPGDPQLVLRGHPAHDDAVMVEQRAERRLVGRQVTTLEDDGVGSEQADLGGDGASRAGVVTRDHRHLDAGLAAGGDGVGGARPWRVLQTDEAEQLQVALDLVGEAGPAWIRARSSGLTVRVATAITRSPR